MTRFRLSAHNLPIETLRYLNIPRSIRFCPFCCSAVGDEKHYFMDCQYIDIAKSRKQLLPYQTGKTPYEEMLALMRSKEPEIVLAVGKHIRTVELLLKV